MRVNPREQILEVWKAAVEFSHRGGTWTWGGRDGRNSISDAEQLLCLLYPATEVSYLQLDDPDEMAEDVKKTLSTIGGAQDITRMVVDVLADYMESHTSASGAPIFAGGSYFKALDPGDELADEQRNLDVVDSFATSLSLTLSALSFLKKYGRDVRGSAMRTKIADLEAVTSRRLSAAMVGLLRSFSINVIRPDSMEEQSLGRLLNQENLPEAKVFDNLRDRLRSLRASLRDATLGLTRDEALDDERVLFECGWSWGVVDGAPTIDTTEEIGDQLPGIALSAPFLYFTVIALDAIADLRDDRVRVLGLLNPEQQRLADGLGLRWSVTLQYWSTLARFGTQKWPLEDIPWRAVDGEETEYFSLLVTAVVLQDLLSRRATDDDLTRTVAVLEKLAVIGGINRRLPRHDSAISLHTPGVAIELYGGEALGKKMSWTVADYAVVLLNRSLRAANLSRNSGTRDRLRTVAEEALGHMQKWRLTTGPAAKLWDDPHDLLVEGGQRQDEPSWYMTRRVIECLTVSAKTISQPPIRSNRLTDLAAVLLAEADHLLSQDKLNSRADINSPLNRNLERIEARLMRARTLLRDKPGTAFALANRLLCELDEVRLGREDANRGN